MDEIALRWMPEEIFDVNIGSGNGLVPSDNRPLLDPKLTQICVITRPQWVKMSSDDILLH